MRRKGLLDSIEREANVAIPESGRRAQVDFRIVVDGDMHSCEIKALCISQAAGTPRNLQFHFRDDHVGLLKDMRKLDKLNGKNKWILGFVYPNPLLADWNRAVAALPSAFQHWKVVTPHSNDSDTLFVSLWDGADVR